MKVVTGFRRPGNAWMGELTRGDNGPHASESNSLLVFANDGDLAGLIAYDEFAHRVVVTRAPPVPFIGARELAGPYPRPVSDTDVTLIQGYVQRTYGMRISHQIASRISDATAEHNRIHPVRNWLAGLKWDGKPRIDTWLQMAFGAPDDAYHQTIGAKFLIASVRRIRQPGCKFDVMLVMEGAQDIGKSTACRALFGHEWFSDELPNIRTREAPLSLLGVWGCEVAELAAVVRTDLEVVKAFLSRQVDRYREMHGRRYVDRPRQAVLIGTTNEKDYLSDPTGNRRFWIFECAKAEPGWIADNREQLWAEAVRADDQCEPLWLDDATTNATARRMQEERVAEDAWTAPVRDHLYGSSGATLTSVRVGDLLHHALGLPRDKQNRSSEMRVSAILKREGWTARIVWRDGRSTRIWEPPVPP